MIARLTIVLVAFGMLTGCCMPFRSGACCGTQMSSYLRDPGQCMMLSCSHRCAYAGYVYDNSCYR